MADVGDGLRGRVEELEVEVEQLRIVQVASIGAHALLEDAEERITTALALHRDCDCASCCDLCTCGGDWPCPTVIALGGNS